MSPELGGSSVQIQLTARHVEVTDDVRNYIQEKVDKLPRFYDRIHEVEVVLDHQSEQFSVEMIVRTDRRHTIVVSETGPDTFALIDVLTDRLERQLTKHKEKNRPRVNKAALERQRKRKLFVYTRYSNGIPECTCCGITGIEFLTIDHIIPKRKMENDPKMIKIGFKSTRKAGALNQWLVTNNFPKGFQILCWNCNFAKGILGKCPHQN